MSTFKHNKGKLVEQPDESKKPNRDNYVSQYKFACDLQDYEAFLRTYIAEGNFAEDELVEENDLEFVDQYCDNNEKWFDIALTPDDYYRDADYRKIARRKVTKEEGEKPDQYQIACEDVLKEVRRAKTMFKEKFVNQHEGYAVILEELDELWDEVKKNQKNYDLVLQRKEAIQCAAMCIRFIAELTPNNLT